MERGSDSVPIVVEEEKHGNSAPIQVSCFLGGAMPVNALMPCGKGRMAHNSRFWRLESSNTHVFQRSILGSVPPRVEAFPWCYCVDAAALPKAVEWIPVPSQQHIALHIG